MGHIDNETKIFTVIQAVEDYDTLIVREATEKSTQFLKLVIVGEDTDILILKLFTTNVFLSPRQLKCSKYI